MIASAVSMSRTDRVITPSETSPPYMSAWAGPCGTRPRDGFSPTRPQQAAGMRIDPAPSVAWAIGTMPEATAAAAPPEEPPALRVRSKGLRVGPKRTGSRGHVEAEFGKIGLAKNAEARLFETYRQFVVLVLRRRGPEGAAGAARALACNARANVLQQERHAGERRLARPHLLPVRHKDRRWR